MHDSPRTRMKDFDAFSGTWLAAWNAHDLDRILDLYEDDFVFSSPVLRKLQPERGGSLAGKAAARAYWSRAFGPGVNLKFEHIATLAGVGSCVIHYRGLRGKLCAEYFRFGAEGRIAESHAHEWEAPSAA